MPNGRRASMAVIKATVIITVNSGAKNGGNQATSSLSASTM